LFRPGVLIGVGIVLLSFAVFGFSLVFLTSSIEKVPQGNLAFFVVFFVFGGIISIILGLVWRRSKMAKDSHKV